jgi:hypothetical protein
MDSLSQQFTKEWWLGVVVVGTLVGVLSAYVKSGLDYAWVGTTRWASRWSQAHRRRICELIVEMAGNPHRQVLAALQAQRFRQEAAEAMFGT